MFKNIIILNSRALVTKCLLFIFLFSYTAKAQVNYVLNPSLEQYWRCPNVYDEIKYAKFWSPISDTLYVIPADSLGNPNCSPEYCNTCAGSNPDCGAPLNGRYYHYPRTGNGMAQVMMFVDSTASGPYQRDYLQGRLYKSLVTGKNYCVTFYVTQEQQSYYSCNHIGAYLDNGIIDTSVNTCGLPKTQFIPQIVENSIINDTLNWVKIEGSFTANGTEKFITIGNFFNQTNTSFTLFNLNGNSANLSLYLVDDVSVVESDTKAYAWNTDTLHKGYLDSFLLGRNEIIPGIKWWRDGVLIDTLNAGIWCKDNVLGTYHTYIVEQTLCGLSTYDTVVVSVEVVSTKETSPVLSKGEVTVWPNPASSVLHVDAQSDLHISILSVEGKVLIRDCFVPHNDPAKGTGQAASGVNVEGLAKGVYLLQVISADGSKEVRRIIKE